MIVPPAIPSDVAIVDEKPPVSPLILRALASVTPADEQAFHASMRARTPEVRCPVEELHRKNAERVNRALAVRKAARRKA